MAVQVLGGCITSDLHVLCFEIVSRQSTAIKPSVMHGSVHTVPIPPFSSPGFVFVVASYSPSPRILKSYSVIVVLHLGHTSTDKEGFQRISLFQPNIYWVDLSESEVKRLHFPQYSYFSQFLGSLQCGHHPALECPHSKITGNFLTPRPHTGCNPPPPLSIPLVGEKNELN